MIRLLQSKRKYSEQIQKIYFNTFKPNLSTTKEIYVRMHATKTGVNRTIKTTTIQNNLGITANINAHILINYFTFYYRTS